MSGCPALKMCGNKMVVQRKAWLWALVLRVSLLLVICPLFVRYVLQFEYSSKEKLGFHPSFSRHGITRASSVLLIWLKENVHFFSFFSLFGAISTPIYLEGCDKGVCLIPLRGEAEIVGWNLVRTNRLREHSACSRQARQWSVGEPPSSR